MRNNMQIEANFVHSSSQIELIYSFVIETSKSQQTYIVL